ncbi:hypothetical protein BDP81DRAFT_185695 [Colletotrichum phormii]|uniref:Uncharacterized protein n=1 Tax=Colletotrichum phormii TaxID=359342 RepID=A0AAI9ZXE6_9PEZI|nr:uncharacterized protein BDP81DRAFT_185695 [Colletotrichum phormii]KAK1639946.1 hypothetical protein BDP81DRAFT_185695 [Colletotrichum phormii]
MLLRVWFDPFCFFFLFLSLRLIPFGPLRLPQGRNDRRALGLEASETADPLLFNNRQLGSVEPAWYLLLFQSTRWGNMLKSNRRQNFPW